MNYCDKAHYNLLSTHGASFDSMVETLLAQLPSDETILRLVFFGKPKDNDEYMEQRTILCEKVRQLLPNALPILSYVSQPPLNGEMLLEIHSYCPDADDRIAFKTSNHFPYVTLENKDGRFLFAGGLQSDINLFSIQQQSVEVFRIACEILHEEGFPIHSIIRQWNYIEGITSLNGVDQHYQMFNNVRSNFYAQATWDNGYPAATGIGTDCGGVLIDFDAALFARPECFATPIDNKLQIAAHAYSPLVLKEAQEQKATPKFERAKSMTFDNRRVIYISGTAAIRGEESLTNVGLEQQLHITMENIALLTDDTPLKLLRVYLKETSFYEEAQRLLNDYKLHIPISYVHADVCRDELLIEIEGIAAN